MIIVRPVRAVSISLSHDDEYPAFLGGQYRQLKQCEKQYRREEHEYMNTPPPPANYRSTVATALTKFNRIFVPAGRIFTEGFQGGGI